MLTSGRTLAVLQVTGAARDRGRGVGAGRAVGPAAWVKQLDAGDGVVAVGRGWRRFYQAGGGAASKVEVEADVAPRGTDRRRVGVALVVAGAPRGTSK